MKRQFAIILILLVALMAVQPAPHAQAQAPTNTPTPVPGMVSNNLIACFNMEEGLGTRIDSTGNTSGLWRRDGDSQLDRQVAGLVDYANQYNSYFDLHNTNSTDQQKLSFYDTQSSFTMSVAVKPENMTSAGGHWIIGRDITNGHREYILWFDGSTKQFVWQIFTTNASPNEWIVVRSDPVLTGDHWYVVTVWFDNPNDELGISVNGEDRTVSQPYSQANTIVSAFIVGGFSDTYNSYGNMFNGRIDTLGVWERVLSEDERLWMYNGGSGRSCAQVISGYIQPVVSVGNVLLDGNMEQHPESSFWFVNTPYGAGDFGRLNDGNLLTVGYGDPRCDNGWQIIGNTTRCSWSILEYYNEMCRRNFAAIRQLAVWPGGVMYYRISARGMPADGWDHDVNINVWVTHKTTNEQTVLYSGPVSYDHWTDLNGSTAQSLPGGQYYINVARGAGSLDDAFVVDDFVIDTLPVDQNVCSQPGESTPAVSPTPTSTGGAPSNLVENCGFSQGPAMWGETSSAYIIYGANNYAHVEKDANGFSQQFYWPGGIAYTAFHASGPYNVHFRNVSTNQTYTVAAGTSTGWNSFTGNVLLPAGNYQLRLWNPALASGPSEYDNVTVSANNYAVCEAGPLVTPTPPATETPDNTPTMWPTRTMKPTNTVPAGGATSTPQPTLTPFPTFTPRPPSTSTPRPSATQTPWATWTAQPTYTALPTYTPNAEGTIAPSPTPPTPPPPQPPPDYYAPCERPLDPTDVGGWLEYEKCQMLSFFAMSPNAVKTVAAVPTMFSDREPFGTISEVQNTSKQMQELINQQDWTESLPGTKDGLDPSIFLAPAADSPLITGEFDFTKKSEPISQECSSSLKTVVGPQLAPGMCWAFNLLKEKGIMPWFQLIINIIALAVFGVYIWKKWIDAGTGG